MTARHEMKCALVSVWTETYDWKQKKRQNKKRPVSVLILSSGVQQCMKKTWVWKVARQTFYWNILCISTTASWMQNCTSTSKPLITHVQWTYSGIIHSCRYFSQECIIYLFNLQMFDCMYVFQVYLQVQFYLYYMHLSTESLNLRSSIVPRKKETWIWYQANCSALLRLDMCLQFKETSVNKDSIWSICI